MDFMVMVKILQPLPGPRVEIQYRLLLMLDASKSLDSGKKWILHKWEIPASGYRPSFSGLTFKAYYFLVSDNRPLSNPTTDGNRYQINFLA